MQTGFNLDDLLTALAKRIAVELSAEIVSEKGGSTIQPRLLTVDQAAAYIGRSKDAVQHMVASGKIPKVQSDRRVFLDREDLDQWIEENKRPAI
jgi:excisionase family DNA binding protein